MDKILDYWNTDNVQSMYDKLLIEKEIEIISSHISKNSNILDVGCGEGEGTSQYASIEGVQIQAIDFSETRIRKAKARMKDRSNVEFKLIDLKKEFHFSRKFDYIITQRSLINLPNWECQKNVISRLIESLAPNGTIILCEGSVQGNDILNLFRNKMDLASIDIRWHNSFICDEKLQDLFEIKNYKSLESKNLGEYYFLTRGIRPVFEKDLNWDSGFNHMAKNIKLNTLIPNIDSFAKVKIWVFKK